MPNTFQSKRTREIRAKIENTKPINNKYKKTMPPGTQTSKFFTNSSEQICVIMEKTYKSGDPVSKLWMWDDIYNEWVEADMNQTVETLQFVLENQK